MVIKLIKKVVGTRNERVIKKFQKMVDQINALEPVMKKLSDAEFKAKTDEFKRRLQDGETLKQILPEAFACVREASVRTLEQRPFDVQLIGGMVLNKGKIAEMRTGEGKTLVATLPAYLNALTGKSVHVVTVNDYLAKRDAEWMEPIYNFLGLTVGVILTNQDIEEKKAAYAADITYGTNNEFGFDYLRDNMAFSLEDKVQRGHYFCIIDEVDSILIDEARTPLIISGPSDESSELYIKIDKLIPHLTERPKKDGKDDEEAAGDYSIDEKIKQAYLTEQGHERIEELLREAGLITEDGSLYDIQNVKLMHYVNAALRAHKLFHRDVDYIVRDDEVIIVDEHTGRTMVGRRWSDGLHQAMEAKEKVNIQNENQTLASITFQNYFRIYEKLSGMTGTADTEAYEFQQIYGLEVVVIPTNKPMIRQDLGDQIYLTEADKFAAVIQDVEERRAKGQPILVGTASIEKSEELAQLMRKSNIPHNVLNAKQHEREANIVIEAGRPGSVTIATNMAGRGTDIVLGGNLKAELAALENPSREEIEAVKAAWQKRHDEVLAAGGLHIVGSERHESRRIDNQLRGRSGRQGDPGSSRFYLSLEDNLMRIFASDRVAVIMQRLGMKEGEAIEHRLVSRAVENAQRKVEGHNFDMRKNLLEYDDVANEQRKVIYSQRDELMETQDVSGFVKEIIRDVLERTLQQHVPPESLEEQWDVAGLTKELEKVCGLNIDILAWIEADNGIDDLMLRDKILDAVYGKYAKKEEEIGSELLRQLEKTVMLQSLDAHWKEHLAGMDHLREGIHLRGYAQKDPKQEYKREAYKMFTQMLASLKQEVVTILFSMRVQEASDIEAVEENRRREAENKPMNFVHFDAGSTLDAAAAAEAARQSSPDELAAMEDGEQEINHTPFVRNMPKVGRNDPCACGSGKKYKQCCGKI